MSKVTFTAGRVAAFSCPAGKSQAFLWDSSAKGLGLRATPAGSPSYVFQGRFNDKTVRMTIGSPDTWAIPKAQEKARELQRQIDEGRDPREVKAERTAADVTKRALDKTESVTFGEAWAVYLAERKPFWSALHLRDHQKMAQLGGEERKRSKVKLTTAGPLAYFVPMRLRDIDAATVQAWTEREVKTRATRTRLAIRLLKAFLRWCAEEASYRGAVNATAASGKKTREIAGSPKTNHASLQREQLAAWFTHVRQIPNPVIAAYLQTLLLTGPRREELLALKWADVDFQWNGLELHDKIEGRRVIPLTPYVSQILSALPRRNQWVFSTPTSASGRLTEPSIAHRKACTAAGVTITLHGLRKSFASLCEWLDIPGGISAQIQGHAPQGVREQNYIRRPLDLLRVHHEKIEAWILEQAAIEFIPTRPALRAVA